MATVGKQRVPHIFNRFKKIPFSPFKKIHFSPFSPSNSVDKERKGSGSLSLYHIGVQFEDLRGKFQ